MDEAYRVGAFNAAANILRESSIFVGGGYTPCGFVCGTAYELAVVEQFASLFVHHRQRLVYFIFHVHAGELLSSYTCCASVL